MACFYNFKGKFYTKEELRILFANEKFLVGGEKVSEEEVDYSEEGDFDFGQEDDSKYAFESTKRVVSSEDVTFTGLNKQEITALKTKLDIGEKESKFFTRLANAQLRSGKV